MLCSDSSREAGEQLAGSALNGIVHWIAVEDRGTRPAKVTMKTDLAPGVLDWFKAMKARPQTRPVLIRRKDKRQGCAVFYARTDSAHVQRLDLAHQGDILNLDWDRMLTEPVQRTETRGPLLVCTHGSRDSCCGRFAPPVLQALEVAAPGRAWHSTHIGGHRFAPTLVALPSGVQFGRVEPEEAAALVRELDAGRLYNVQRVRGRTHMPMPAQAAALWWREHADRDIIDEVVFVNMIEDGDSSIVHLNTPAGPQQLRVTQRQESFDVLGSCAKVLKPANRWVVRPAAE